MRYSRTGKRNRGLKKILLLIIFTAGLIAVLNIAYCCKDCIGFEETVDGFRKGIHNLLHPFRNLTLNKETMKISGIYAFITVILYLYFTASNKNKRDEA